MILVEETIAKLVKETVITEIERQLKIRNLAVSEVNKRYVLEKLAIILLDKDN